MLSEYRYAKILEELKRNKMVRTSRLVKTLNVSSETIRKDLEHLDKEGLLTKVHGGAVSVSDMSGSLYSTDESYEGFEERQEKNQDLKISIARKALDYIHNGQSIALDSGTTSYELAKLLNEYFKTMTIVTNSVNIALELVEHKGFTVILTGGILNADEHSLVSELATSFLNNVNLDLMFLTTCGVSLEKGITDQRIDEVRIHNKMKERSACTIVLADKSKIGVSSLISVCPIEEVDMIITNDSIDPSLAAKFERYGYPLVLAP